MEQKINPQLGALLDASDILRAVSGRIYHDAFFRGIGPSAETLNQLQDVQHIIDKHPFDAPCTRCIQAWCDYLVGANAGLMREKYSQNACTAFYNESLRLQREFDAAAQTSSK